MPKLISTNPAKNYEEIGSVEISTLAEIKSKVQAARKAQEKWGEIGVEKRIALLKPILAEFKKQKRELADIITKEIGKPITQSLEDIDFDVDYFEWFLDNGAKILKPEVTSEDKESIHTINYEPIGVVAAIVPWNYPSGNFLWAVIPNLIAGNTVVFKHSEECPLCGKKMEEIMTQANLPQGVFSEVYGDGKAGEILVNQDVDMIWFTGSTKVGKRLYEIAGKKFIKSISELGGSNPGIVCQDADINEAVESIYGARFSNAGQVCDALKRLIVHRSIFDKVIEKLKIFIEKKVVGDPKDIKTDIGSLVAKRQLELLESQVKDARQKGAKVITDGKPAENLSGAYYPPTIITNVTKEMRVWQEEVFGPVLPIVAYDTDEEAIELANDTKYGLGAYVYCQDRNKAKKIASQIKGGNISINGQNHFIPCNPFGGYKESGMGREHGAMGFRELCQVKVVSSKK